MTASLGESGNVFNPEKLLNESKIDLLTIMLIIGIDIDLIDSITIDEIIERIRSIYDYQSLESEMQFIEHSDTVTAPAKIIKIENLLLTRRIRRAWFNKQFAEEVINNEL